MDKEVEQFYEDFYESEFMDNATRFELKKIFYNKKLTNNKVYKYISFNNDFELNKLKIQSFRNQGLWFGAYYTFNDQTELDINIDYNKVSKATNIPKSNLVGIVNCFRQMNDICCLTTSLRNKMWNDYANNYNGICLCFDVKSYEYILPVIYSNKKEIDFTETLIVALKSTYNYNSNIDITNIKAIKRLTFEPLVLKDYNTYAYEDEVRLYCGEKFDDINDELGGRVYPKIKEKLKYTGCNYSYEKLGLELCEIYLGKNLDNSIKKEIITIANNQNVKIIEFKETK